MPTRPKSLRSELLSRSETRKSLTAFVRKRAPQAEVDDLVQTVMVEALASDKAPDEEGELMRWLMGIARHKVADLHRKKGRERPTDDVELPMPPPPIEEREMTRWAERQSGGSDQAKQTLEWMAREGEGDKLEHIAAEEDLPAARVRQRVSRMRRFMKERWLAELAAVAALALLALMVYRWLQKPPEGPIVKEEAPKQEPRIAEAQELRQRGLALCEAGKHESCLGLLDQAQELDPAGDSAPEIGRARDFAERAIEQLDKDEQRKNGPDSNLSPTAVPDVSSQPKEPAPFTDEKSLTPIQPGPFSDQKSPTNAKPAPTAPPAPVKSPSKSVQPSKPSPKSGFSKE